MTRKGLADDVKLGPGGIREIEFMVQIFQLIRGGREPSLRRRALESVPGVEEATVTVTFDPPWSPEMMSPQARAALGWAR